MNSISANFFDKSIPLSAQSTPLRMSPQNKSEIEEEKNKVLQKKISDLTSEFYKDREQSVLMMTEIKSKNPEIFAFDTILIISNSALSNQISKCLLIIPNIIKQYYHLRKLMSRQESKEINKNIQMLANEQDICYRLTNILKDLSFHYQKAMTQLSLVCFHEKLHPFELSKEDHLLIMEILDNATKTLNESDQLTTFKNSIFYELIEFIKTVNSKLDNYYKNYQRKIVDTQAFFSEFTKVLEQYKQNQKSIYLEKLSIHTDIMLEEINLCIKEVNHLLKDLSKSDKDIYSRFCFIKNSIDKRKNFINDFQNALPENHISKNILRSYIKKSEASCEIIYKITIAFYETLRWEDFSNQYISNKKEMKSQSEYEFSKQIFTRNFYARRLIIIQNWLAITDYFINSGLNNSDVIVIQRNLEKLSSIDRLI